MHCSPSYNEWFLQFLHFTCHSEAVKGMQWPDELTSVGCGLRITPPRWAPVTPWVSHAYTSELSDGWPLPMRHSPPQPPRRAQSTCYLYVMGQFIQNVFNKPMNLFHHSIHRVHSSLYIEWDFPVAQMVQNLPAMQETLVLSLGWEEPLEKGMATHSCILGWRIPWAWRATVHGVAKSQVQLDD